MFAEFFSRLKDIGLNPRPLRPEKGPDFSDVDTGMTFMTMEGAREFVQRYLTEHGLPTDRRFAINTYGENNPEGLRPGTYCEIDVDIDAWQNTTLLRTAYCTLITMVLSENDKIPEEKSAKIIPSGYFTQDDRVVLEIKYI